MEDEGPGLSEPGECVYTFLYDEAEMAKRRGVGALPPDRRSTRWKNRDRQPLRRFRLRGKGRPVTQLDNQFIFIYPSKV